MKKLLLFIILILFMILGLSAQNYPMITPGNQPVIDTETENTEPVVFKPLLFWERPPAAAPGDRITLILRTNSQITRMPPPSFFKPEVPRGVLLTSLPVSAQERESGILLKLTLIPLAAGSITFPARILFHENTNYEIPALNITVTQKPQ
ncbi:MAG: hypothetical protein FWD14_03295 [Treponema sp.]|nr:hypothetical protein [Treponema sp.]